MGNLVSFEAKHMAVGFDLSVTRNLKPGAMSDGSSARFIKDTAIYTGPGYFRQTVLGTGVKVDDLFGSKNNSFKTLWAKSGTKLFHNAHGQNLPYDIGLTLTATERQAFEEVQNGNILTFNQADSPVVIAIAKLTAAVTDLATGTFDVGAGNIDKFAASGSVYIRGVSYTYSGVSSTALTGLGGGPLPSGGLSVDDLVTQTSTPASFAVAKGTCSMVIEGSTIVAGVKGREDILYIGAPATFDDPQFAYDFNDNGASAKVSQNPVVAMIKGSTLGFIFGHNYIDSTPGFDVDTGVLVTRPVSNVAGAYNARCVIDMGGKIGFLGSKRFTPIDIVLSQDGVATGKLNNDFDDPILPWLQTLDPADMQLNVACVQFDPSKQLVSITASVDGATQTRLFDISEGVKAFLPPEVRPLRCHTYFDGDSYFGSNSNDRVYRNHVTRTNDGFPILHRWRTGWLESYARTGKKGKQEFLPDYLDFDGYMSQGCEFTVNFYIDGNTTTPVYSVDIDDSIITADEGIPLGNRGIGGLNLIGGGDTTPAKGYRFNSCNIDLNGLNCTSIMVEWVCSKLGAFLQTESWIMEAKGVTLTRAERI